MKFYILLILTVVANLILQLLFVEYLSVSGAGPQIMLVGVIFYSLRYGALFGEIFGFVSGVFLDTFSISVFGVHGLVFTLVGYIYGNFSKKLNENKVGVQMLLAFLASCLQVGVVSLASVVFASKAGISVSAMAIGPAYTALLSPFLIMFYNVWSDFTEKWSGKTNLG
jgi:rod shape-determining protein MreD